MKYEKPMAEVTDFRKTEFMAGSGNMDGGYCNHYQSPTGISCEAVHECSEYGLPDCPLDVLGAFDCNNWYECDGVAGPIMAYFEFEVDGGFYCRGF